MPKALRVYETGPPDVFRWEDVEVPAPGAGEVLLRHTAVGVNFVDTYHRAGKYHPWKVEPPFVVGFEAAGVVEETGPGVSGVAPGDRVAYASPPVGEPIIESQVGYHIRTGGHSVDHYDWEQFLKFADYHLQPGR